MYLIDRNAYAYALYCTQYENDGAREVWQLLDRFRTLMEERLDAILSEISQRDCSHDEDRVLSVSGLLGLGGKMKQLIGAGRRLDEQILEMGKSLAMERGSVGYLLQLCASFPTAYRVEGLSKIYTEEGCCSCTDPTDHQPFYVLENFSRS